MCTTGVLRLGPNEYLLFKNKDFVRDHFEDRVVVESEVFGVEGITTWAETDPELDQFSGFSIGANADGVLACDSNVRTVPDSANYDNLVEIALRSGGGVESGAAAVEEAVAKQPYLWGNILIADGDSQVAVEVRGQQTARVRLSSHSARANHHTKLGVHPDNDDTVTSEARLASAQCQIEKAKSREDVFELLESHDNRDTGVCNHSLYQTVYSYVLHHRAGETTLYVRKGSPCQQNEIHQLSVPLGEKWTPAAEVEFRLAYPSARTVFATSASKSS